MGERQRPQHTVADILRRHLGEYRRNHKLSYEQTRVVNDILKCRTAAMGGFVLKCDVCGHVEVAYKSCKNRHCPNCGHFEKAQWLEGQRLWVLPIPYYHVVFTIDHVFNPLVWRNKKKLYDLLMRTAAKELQAYGRKYLGGEIGVTMVLHTWGQKMQAHVHVHCIVTGGALVASEQGYRWQAAKNGFLFPVKQLSRDFRRVFCRGVRKLWKKGKLDSEGLDVEAMLSEAESKAWEVYIQKPFWNVENLLEYLGRYIFRIAISNYRIVEFARGKVTFEYYDNRDEGKLKKMTLPAVEFIRRFLLHVLPRRFQRIRHYGLHHSSCREKLRQARRALGLEGALPGGGKLKLVTWLKDILGEEAEPGRCPRCGQGELQKVKEFGPTTELRVWLGKLLIGPLARWGPAYGY